jgi:hypothetical protein
LTIARARALAVSREDPSSISARALIVMLLRPQSPVVRDATANHRVRIPDQAEWLAPVYLFLSAHCGYRRLAVHLHMSVGRVVFGPHRIGWVPSQLVINWAPVRTEPLIKIIKVYGKIVF